MANGIINLFRSQQQFKNWLQNTRPTGVHNYQRQTDNPDAYEDEIERNQIIENNNLSFQFTGIYNRSEAIEMLEKGYKAPLEQFKKDVNDRFADKEEIYVYAPSGPHFNVGLAAKGISKCYIRPKTIESTQTKIINLCIDTGVSWHVSKAQLTQYGINICKAIKALEKNNYRINLFSGVGTAKRNWLEMILVQLKKADQKLNVANLCYPLAHPSFLRCLVFEWQDKVEGGRDMGDGRGHPTLDYFNTDEVEDLIHRILGYNMIYVNIQYASSPESVINLVRRRSHDPHRRRR